MKTPLFIKIVVTLIVALTVIGREAAIAGSVFDTLFPLDNYDQRLSTWINPNDSSYDQALLSNGAQQYRKEELINHLLGSSSPWNQAHVSAVLRGDLMKTEETFFSIYNNKNEARYYGAYETDPASAVPYQAGWLDMLQKKSNLSLLNGQTYNTSKRAILIQNTAARVLPTTEPAFLNPTSPGEGVPFDYLQMSAAWIGTPVYILGTTTDKMWDLVLTPDFIAWVENKNVATASEDFITTWTTASQAHLIAITQTATSLKDAEGNLLSLAYVGSCFPQSTTSSSIMVPVADQNNNALIKESVLPLEAGASIPLKLSPHNMSNIIGTLIGRAYQWGGIDFENDCSAEIKSLFLPFGIYLPRHSSDQMSAGAMIDKSSATPEERLNFLTSTAPGAGKPFLSLIYIGGHVMLYLGAYGDESDPNALKQAMTYQNLWGLRPAPPFTNANPEKRFIVGKSVLFPLLLEYPEAPNAVSLAAKSFFQISDLSQWPLSQMQSMNVSWQNRKAILREKQSVDLKPLMYPEHLYEASVGYQR